MEIAVFGSSFDPPHLGHLDALEQVASLRRFHEILLVPSVAHPFAHKRNPAPFDLRLGWLRALRPELDGIESIHGVRLTVSDIERELQRPGESVYTIDLLDTLRRRNPSGRYVFVLGPDHAENEGWKRYREAERIAGEYGFVFVTQRIAARSTLCRERARAGDGEGLARMVGGPLSAMILAERVYSNVPPAKERGHETVPSDPVKIFLAKNAVTEGIPP